MYGKVKRLRDRGARLPEHDILRAVPVEGSIVVAGIGGTLMAEVRDPNAQVGTGLLPPLYEVRLLGMHNGKILLKGEERPNGTNGPAYVQEWSISVEPR
jgi:hypothetical protein